MLIENELKNLEGKVEKVQTYDSSLSISQSYIFSDGAQLYLRFQTLYYILKRLGDTEKIVSCKCRYPYWIVFLHHLNGKKVQIFV